jgi:hypothetical protein
MSLHPNDDHSKANIDDPQRVRSPAAWIVGLTFLIALLGVLAFYSGEDHKPKSGDNPPNVVSQSRGSK